SMHLRFTIIFGVALSILPISHAANLELGDIAKVDPTIVIDLRYATEHNVTGHALYPQGKRALILPSVAQQLSGVQSYLKQYRYRYNTRDAYRQTKALGQFWTYA